MEGEWISTRMRCIKWCHLQWPWTNLNPVFKVTPLFDSTFYLDTSTTVNQTCLKTDHYLVHRDLQLASERPRVVSYSYRNVKSINLDKFRDDLSQSKLLQCFDDPDADSYAKLLNRELRLLMDRHAPIRRTVKRCGKNDCRWLSPEARTTKQRRQRLERRYRRTGNMSDKRA